MTLRRRIGQRTVVRVGPRSYHYRCIPPHFPRWTSERHGHPQAQFYLVTPTLGGHGSRDVILFDRNGAPVWWMEQKTKPHDAKLMPDGNFAWSTFTNGAYASHSVPYQEHALDGRLVRRIAMVGAPTDGHDMEELPNGDYMVVGYVPRRHVDLSPYGGPRDATVVDGEVQEVTPGGKRVWRWNSGDHIALDESGPFMSSIVNGPVVTADGSLAYDIVHLNSVALDGDGFVISFRQTDSIYKVSRATGQVEWKLGGTDTPQSLDVPAQPNGLLVMSGQHDARVLPDGTITMHDNRTLTELGPRAVRYAVDPQDGTASEIEEVSDPHTRHSTCCGGARKMPGGNWAVSWGLTGLVTETTPEGRRVYALHFRPRSAVYSYRVFPVMPGQLSLRALRRGMDAMARR